MSLVRPVGVVPGGQGGRRGLKLRTARQPTGLKGAQYTLSGLCLSAAAHGGSRCRHTAYEYTLVYPGVVRVHSFEPSAMVNTYVISDAAGSISSSTCRPFPTSCEHQYLPLPSITHSSCERHLLIDSRRKREDWPILGRFVKLEP